MFRYTGYCIDIISRAAQTVAVVAKLKSIWKERNICLKPKIGFFRALTSTVYMYSCEYCTLTSELQKTIQAFERRCYRPILGISCVDLITNDSARYHETRNRSIGILYNLCQEEKFELDISKELVFFTLL